LNFPKPGKLFFHFFENFLNGQIDGFHREQNRIRKGGSAIPSGDAKINAASLPV
jgi:hypothetical protein